MALPAMMSAGAVLAAGLVTLPLFDLGPLSLHMAVHLAVMNVAAPLSAIVLARRLPAVARRPALFWAAGLVQIVLLWAWHAPSMQQAAAGSTGLHLVMLASLTLASLFFWALLLGAAATARWRAIAALLLTGKLACLLGGLLIFAPRELYGLPGFSFMICSVGPSTLADQQLAGLLMITACPLSYVVAGVVVAAQFLADLERKGGARGAYPIVASG